MTHPQITVDQRNNLARWLHRRLERMEAILLAIAQAIQAAPSQARKYMLKVRTKRVLDLHRQTRELHALLFSAEFHPFVAPRR